MSMEAQEEVFQGRRFDGIDADTGERIMNNIAKIRFVADAFSTGKLELTNDGREGVYWILADIANDLEKAVDGVE